MKASEKNLMCLSVGVYFKEDVTLVRDLLDQLKSESGCFSLFCFSSLKQ